MTTNFDLISDLHLESSSGFSWAHKATSLFCIVAGNVSRDHDVVFDILEELSEHYEGVFFIDGILEHELFDGDFNQSYLSLNELIDEIDNVIFLHENIVVLNNVTLIATNGWTTFDFTLPSNLDYNISYLDSSGLIDEATSNEIFKFGISDQHYLYNSIDTCQTMSEVRNVIIITNAVPIADFVTHDDDLDGTVAGDMIGNSGLVGSLLNDTEGKVTTWLFGRYSGDLDFVLNGIRYVNNPAQNKDPGIYYPKVITA
jgi:hypothetical protein